MSHFLSLGNQLEAFFIERRQLFAHLKPEEVRQEVSVARNNIPHSVLHTSLRRRNCDVFVTCLTQEISELRQELQSKEALLAQHQDRLKRWKSTMEIPHQQLGLHYQQQQQHQQQQQQQQQASTSATTTGGAQSQGHLAYLEQTTSNIGINGRKS